MRRGLLLMVLMLAGCSYFSVENERSLAVKDRITESALTDLRTAQDEIKTLAGEDIKSERERVLRALRADFEARAGQILETAAATEQDPRPALLALNENYIEQRLRLDRQVEELAQSYGRIIAKVGAGSKALEAMATMDRMEAEAREQTIHSLFSELVPVGADALATYVGTEQARQAASLLRTIYGDRITTGGEER